jgi:hypothetical protein
MTTITIQQALARAASHDLDHLDAQVLLCHVLGVERSRLYAYPNRNSATSPCSNDARRENRLPTSPATKNFTDSTSWLTAAC